MFLKNFQGQWFYHLPEQPLSVLDHPYSEEIYPSVPHKRHHAGPAPWGRDTPLDAAFPKHICPLDLIPHEWEEPPQGDQGQPLQLTTVLEAHRSRGSLQALCGVAAHFLCLSQALCQTQINNEYNTRPSCCFMKRVVKQLCSLLCVPTAEEPCSRHSNLQVPSQGTIKSLFLAVLTDVHFSQDLTAQGFSTCSLPLHCSPKEAGINSSSQSQP